MSEVLPMMRGPFDAEDDFNLTVIRTAHSVLLGRKARGFGAGNLVLPGGKTRYYLGTGMVVIPFEEEAAREALEETGLPISPSQLTQKGILHIADENDTKTVRLYEAMLPAATPATSTELSEIGWHPTDDLPYGEMPSDYKLWLPHLLAGYAVTAYLENNSDQLVAAQLFRQKLDPLERAEEVIVDPTNL